MAASAPTPSTGPSGCSLRRSLVIVALIALAARLLSGPALPLLLTNDSLDYASTALRIVAGEAAEFRAVRTPGYPVLLAGAFALLGVSGPAVIVLQHALGLATALLATLAAARFVRPAWAAVVGGLVALDPFLLGFAHLMLAESATTCAFMLAVTAAVHIDRASDPDARRWPATMTLALLTGLALAAACLIRPAMQAAVPFVILGVFAAAGISLRRRFALFAAALLGFAVLAAPWLVHNARRGVNGFGEGFAWALWVSLVQQDLYDREHPVPDSVKPAAAMLTAEKDGGQVVWAFLADPAVAAQGKAFYRDWAFASIRKRPGDYARRVGWALLWQANCFPASGPITWEQTRVFLRRITMDSGDGVRPPNFMTGDPPPATLALGMPARGGLVRAAFAWWVDAHPTGFPQVPLVLLAILGGCRALWTRRWIMVGVIAASGAIYAVHAVMVFYQSRYSLPAWIAWYPIAAYTLSEAAAMLARWRAARAAR